MSLIFADKFGLLRTPLQKIITGGTLVGVAFVISAIVELELEDTYPHPPGADEARLSFHNGLSLGEPCSVNVTFLEVPEDIDSLNISRKNLAVRETSAYFQYVKVCTIVEF